jgi:hypothetical protein
MFSFLASTRAQVTITHEFAALLVPKTESEAFEAGKERNRLHGVEEWIGLVAFLEVVIGNARTEMMDVMKTNVARKPLQQPGKFVEGTSL